jgi:hypothetical protein
MADFVFGDKYFEVTIKKNGNGNDLQCFLFSPVYNDFESQDPGT